MKPRSRRRLIVLVLVSLLAAVAMSYRNRALAESERRFRERYGD